MKIPIVNEKDELIRYKERKLVKLKDIYRVSALWVTDSKGNILLARRALIKKRNPGKWGPAVAGTVEEGETYKQNIIKEAEEELGITNTKFNKAQKVRHSRTHNYFLQWYTLTIDDYQFKIDKTEVEEIKWFSSKELKQQLEQHPNKFLKSMDRWVDLFS